MLRQLKILTGTLTAVAALALVALPSGAHAGPAASAAKACNPPDYPGSGYFTSLSVTGVSCAGGRRLAKAYYRCRTENGPAGRCNRRVRNYSCTETRNSIPTELDARVRCKRGEKHVTHTYQQDL